MNKYFITMAVTWVDQAGWRIVWNYEKKYTTKYSTVSLSKFNLSVQVPAPVIGEYRITKLAP